jgi:hypothetical protein
MSRSNRRISVPAAITIVAVAVIALIASGILRPTPVAGVPPSHGPTWVPSVPPAVPAQPAEPAPSSPAQPQPSLPATPAPATPAPATPAPATPAPAKPAPSQDPDGEPDNIETIDLDVAVPGDVRITVVDDGDVLAGAKSGHAGDGMSVRWYDLKVDNVDDSTLRVTWVGFAGNDESVLNVGENDGVISLAMSVAGPPRDSDATGYDRVLLLSFDAPVNAADVTSTVQEGFDTAS